MAFSPQHREPPRLPSILIGSNQPDNFGPSQSPSCSRYSPSEAMSIPGAQVEPGPPPPLPPPRFPFGGGPPEDARDYHRDPRSLFTRDHGYGSFSYNLPDSAPNYKRRGAGMSMDGDRDEGYSSLSTASTRSKASLPAEFGLHHSSFRFRSSADAYGEGLKNKLNPIRTFDKSPPHRSMPLSASATDVLTRRAGSDNRFPPPLTVPISLPIHTRSSVLDSPDRFTHTPLHSAVSPRAPYLLNPINGEQKSPNETDLDRSPQHRSRRTNSGSIPDDATVSTQGSYEFNGVEDMDMEETSSLRRLRIDDRPRQDYHTVGQKRRASSPLGEGASLHGVSSQSDLLRRRDITSRGSPTPRLTTIPQGSMSSISTTVRTGSFASNFSAGTPSSATSMNSVGRRSPGGLSPGGMSPISSEPGCTSPFATPISLNTSPRGSLSLVPLAPLPPHQRNGVDNRPGLRRLTNIRPAVITPKVQGFLMCECCPKKPKKFETADELSAHQAEKQYECGFCGNRFKNKNEAERHQNSLHVRRHSWSCKALSGYDRAFHESTNRPGEADTCGYCGDEYSRSGALLPDGSGRSITDQDWEDRVRHLQEAHKFGECNSSKKFYRADHFRQHLKHSHAGTSGKWTNMLENACMMEEDPTPR